MFENIINITKYVINARKEKIMNIGKETIQKKYNIEYLIIYSKFTQKYIIYKI